MQPGREPLRSIAEDLRDLDETDQAIERLSNRIDAQQLRVAQLKRDRVDANTAEAMLENMRASVKQLVMHRALVVHAMARRSAGRTRADRFQGGPI
ncbi:hypothetical protein [Cupriavidus taiwanensis]|uniref:Uncharacterized protein n=1 Tax=Cupriavidus taiwanensis TaxID=164546 RepID=A0A375IXA8_9BURK|nr:hypothetical protein [Cupriavidus taiwanensis]SPR97615.1 conserved hypothetical protein [Cupriavidus taiwanensis]